MSHRCYHWSRGADASYREMLSLGRCLGGHIPDSLFGCTLMQLRASKGLLRKQEGSVVVPRTLKKTKNNVLKSYCRLGFDFYNAIASSTGLAVGYFAPVPMRNRDLLSLTFRKCRLSSCIRKASIVP